MQEMVYLEDKIDRKVEKVSLIDDNYIPQPLYKKETTGLKIRKTRSIIIGLDAIEPPIIRYLHDPIYDRYYMFASQALSSTNNYSVHIYLTDKFYGNPTLIGRLSEYYNSSSSYDHGEYAAQQRFYTDQTKITVCNGMLYIIYGNYIFVYDIENWVRMSGREILTRIMYIDLSSEGYITGYLTNKEDVLFVHNNEVYLYAYRAYNNYNGHLLKIKVDRDVSGAHLVTTLIRSNINSNFYNGGEYLSYTLIYNEGKLHNMDASNVNTGIRILTYDIDTGDVEEYPLYIPSTSTGYWGVVRYASIAVSTKNYMYFMMSGYKNNTTDRYWPNNKQPVVARFDKVSREWTTILNGGGTTSSYGSPSYLFRTNSNDQSYYTNNMKVAVKIIQDHIYAQYLYNSTQGDPYRSFLVTRDFYKSDNALNIRNTSNQYHSLNIDGKAYIFGNNAINVDGVLKIPYDCYDLNTDELIIDFISTGCNNTGWEFNLLIPFLYNDDLYFIGWIKLGPDDSTNKIRIIKINNDFNGFEHVNIDFNNIIDDTQNSFVSYYFNNSYDSSSYVSSYYSSSINLVPNIYEYEDGIIIIDKPGNNYVYIDIENNICYDLLDHFNIDVSIKMPYLNNLPYQDPACAFKNNYIPGRFNSVFINNKIHLFYGHITDSTTSRITPFIKPNGVLIYYADSAWSITELVESDYDGTHYDSSDSKNGEEMTTLKHIVIDLNEKKVYFAADSPIHAVGDIGATTPRMDGSQYIVTGYNPRKFQNTASQETNIQYSIQMSVWDGAIYPNYKAKNVGFLCVFNNKLTIIGLYKAYVYDDEKDTWYEMDSFKNINSLFDTGMYRPVITQFTGSSTSTVMYIKTGHLKANSIDFGTCVLIDPNTIIEEDK